MLQLSKNPPPPQATVNPATVISPINPGNSIDSLEKESKQPQSSNNSNSSKEAELDLKLFNNLKLALTGGAGSGAGSGPTSHHMTAHSTPLLLVNKSLAVPLSKDNKQVSNSNSDHQKIGKLASTLIILVMYSENLEN